MSSFLVLVGNKVRLLRKEKGMTQEELAEQCGIQNTYIGGIERGERNISLNTIETLAEGLGVFPYELLKFDDLKQDVLNDKRTLIESHRNLLFNRSEDEIRMLQKMTKELLYLIDKQRN
ncbi:helix-turn-helix domain-containing protein [Bacillus sp. FJAT-45350]|uniref:helix-turn-helix domain-containing protein n=1 Tax=Bacillus sp. FJAT-45350 TaxID=2011014 RepID=UPI000BB8DC7D|nr:helix-turn-helix transcriptional regulator [Bacillus sp. FJAT-45350]